MIQIVEQTINFYTKNFKVPKIEELQIKNLDLLNRQGSVFVTIYRKGEIRGSSGNIKEIEVNIALELIEDTVKAISKDSRFKPIKLDEVKDLKIRIDEIINRQILQTGEIIQVDPSKNGVLAIKKDYSKMAVILPNINPLLLTGEDLIPVLEQKFQVKKFDEKDYILYKVETNVVDNFETK